MGSISGPGRSHMPWSNYLLLGEPMQHSYGAHVPQPLCYTTREAATRRSSSTATKNRPIRRNQRQPKGSKEDPAQPKINKYVNLLKNMKWSESRSIVSDSLQPHGLHSPWNSPGQNTGVGSLSLLQGIFPTRGSNLGLPHCRQILYQLSHKGSQKKKKKKTKKKDTDQHQTNVSHWHGR